MTTMAYPPPGTEQSSADALSGILLATADSFAAARAVMDAAARTAFTFFADASAADQSRIMTEVSESTLVHDAILAGYANALDAGTAGANTFAKSLGYRSVSDLLQHELGRKQHEAAMLVRLGAVISDGTYPTLAVALEDGRISLQQAGVIVDVLDEEVRRFDTDTIEQIEAAATELAIGSETELPLKPEQLRKLVRTWFAKLQPERAELNTADQYSMREAVYGTTKTGMLRIRALLPAAEGASVVQFLDANAAPRVRFTDPQLQETACCCVDPTNQCGAAYVTHPGSNTDKEELLVTSHCDDCEPEDSRTRKQKMADAFSNAFQVATRSNETSTQGGACPTLTVTIPVSELDKHALGLPALATAQRTEEVVPAHVAARILCDGAVRAAVTDTDGEVLYLGRAKRLFTPAQRSALAVTYPSCAVGDCDVPAVWCEAHHVTLWSHGGATDLDNGILLCNYHHHQVHAGNLDIARHRRSQGTGGQSRPRWRVRRKARIRAGTNRPQRANRGPVEADPVNWQSGRTRTRRSQQSSLESGAIHPASRGITGARGRTDRPKRQRIGEPDDDPAG